MWNSIEHIVSPTKTCHLLPVSTKSLVTAGMDLQHPLKGVQAGQQKQDIQCSGKTVKGCEYPSLHEIIEIITNLDFPGGLGIKDLPAKAGDMGLIPGLARFHTTQGN